MTISDYIFALEQLRAEAGDLEVVQGVPNTTIGSIDPARHPVIREVAAMTKRERNTRVMYPHEGPERSTGRKVVYVGR